MSKRDVKHGPRKPFEQRPRVGLLMDEAQDVAAAALQDVGEVVVVSGHHAARVSRELPVLVGLGADLHLRGGSEGEDER